MEAKNAIIREDRARFLQQHRKKTEAWSAFRSGGMQGFMTWQDRIAAQRQAMEELQMLEVRSKMVRVQQLWWAPAGSTTTVPGGQPLRPQEDGLIDYLEAVQAIHSTMVLWASKSLTTIHTHPWRYLAPILQEINFSENSLKVIPIEVVTLPNLKRLYLHTNQLRALPALSGAPLLEVLDLHNNQLMELPMDLNALTNLQALDVEKNKLKHLSPELNPDLITGLFRKLSYLNLAKNAIKVVPIGLAEFANLSYLNLRLNPISNLPPHVYHKGHSAVMDFLKEHSASASSIAPSSIQSDLALFLMPQFSTAQKAAQSASDRYCVPLFPDLVLVATKSDQKSSQDNASASSSASPASQDQAAPLYIAVNRVVIAARSSRIRRILTNHAQSEHVLPKHSVKLRDGSLVELDLLALDDISSHQLDVLVQYLYTDTFTQPEYDVVQIKPHMSPEERDQLVLLNRNSYKEYEEKLARSRAVANLYELPHLLSLVQDKQAATTTTTFVQNFKQAFVETSSPDPANSWLLPAAPMDVSFSFPNEPEEPVIHAHKAILCSRSKFFTSMFTGGMKESKERVIAIQELSRRVFVSLIEFCYSDDVEELDADTIIDLMKAAKLYGMDRLVGIVESVVGYSLDVLNICSILTISYVFGFARLAKACQFFLFSHWDAVISSAEWTDVPEALRNRLAEKAAKWGVGASEQAEESSAEPSAPQKQ